MSYRSVLNHTDIMQFGSMIQKTKSCLDQKGINSPIEDENTFKEALKCEVAYFSEGNAYTYHTHPNGNPRPSEADIRTTNKFHKKFMFIGLVPSREVVVYEAPKFDKLVGRFKV